MKIKIILVILVVGTLLSQNWLRKPTTEVRTPMGHEMEYVKHIDEFLYVYRDTYTGTHYIVSLINGNATIYRPVYRNENMETVKTN
jgi:hypothetical protein